MCKPPHNEKQVRFNKINQLRSQALHPVSRFLYLLACFILVGGVRGDLTITRALAKGSNADESEVQLLDRMQRELDASVRDAAYDKARDKALEMAELVRTLNRPKDARTVFVPLIAKELQEVCKLTEAQQARYTQARHLGRDVRSELVQGRIVEAHRLLAKARSEFEQLLGPNTASVLDIGMKQLDATYFLGLWGEKNYLRDGLTLAGQQTRIASELCGKDSAQAASGLSMEAMFQSELGNAVESLRLEREALRIRRLIYGSNDLSYAVSLGRVGARLSDIGNEEEAEVLLRQSLGTIDLYEGNAVLRAGMASRLAKNSARMGEEDKALAIVDEELSKLESGVSQSIKHLQAVADLLEVQLSVLKQREDVEGSTHVARRLKDHRDLIRKRIGSSDGK